MVRRVLQNLTKSCACRANFSRVHRVQYNLSSQNMGTCPYLGALAVLDDLKISNFPEEACHQTPLVISMFMLHRSVPPKKGDKQCEQGMWK